MTEGGRGREFAEQRYPTTADVRVHWDDPSDSIVDAVKGLNMGHALTRAGANWPTAKLIELLRATKTAAPTIAEKAAPLVPKSFGPLARTGPVTGAKQLLDRYELARLRGLVHPGAK
ncbi:MAG: hypothetical protein ACREJC_17275 [Tepidisphaeraceae bacterium]